MYTKNLPTELPGYGLAIHTVCSVPTELPGYGPCNTYSMFSTHRIAWLWPCNTYSMFSTHRIAWLWPLQYIQYVQYPPNCLAMALQYIQYNIILFQADPDSEKWKKYVTYLDEAVVDGFYSCILCSLQYLSFNTDKSSNDIPPLLVCKLELQAPDMVLIPSLDQVEKPPIRDTPKEDKPPNKGQAKSTHVYY